jgi:hypothetical protein
MLLKGLESLGTVHAAGQVPEEALLEIGSTESEKNACD